MIEQFLIQAYKTTEFKVPSLNLVIRVDDINSNLDKTLEEHNEIFWAFITAYNPFSQTLSDEENERLHILLLKKVDNYKHYEGYGVGADPSWPPEKSLFIIGITRDEAIYLGNFFNQNAIVTGAITAPAELVLLK